MCSISYQYLQRATAGALLGIMYYYYLLKKIPFPYNTGPLVAILLTVLLGIGSAVSFQIRCILLLLFPMYCGKPGRGVLKAMVFSYVIAGPITNMCMNAREVVRIFSCSAQLTGALAHSKHRLMTQVFDQATEDIDYETARMRDTFLSFRDAFALIEKEIEEVAPRWGRDDLVDKTFGKFRRSREIEKKYRICSNDCRAEKYRKMFMKKIEYRCENQISRGVRSCMNTFTDSQSMCEETLPPSVARRLCSHLAAPKVCNLTGTLHRACDLRKHTHPAFGEGYATLKKVATLFNRNDSVEMQYKVHYFRKINNIQGAKETGERVTRAFEEKMSVLRYAVVIVNVCLALLFLRIFSAAQTYHDLYLTDIDHDNVYTTDYFKKLDERRAVKGKYTLLPLKKMEKTRYIDPRSTSYMPYERHKLVAQVLKLVLEGITATTFVMLDRLFYEALDLVQHNARVDYNHTGTHDLSIQVEGTGVLASILRKLVAAIDVHRSSRSSLISQQCLPTPTPLPPVYYFHIYGGYMWILMLLCCNAYTVRLRRLICSYFYPHREKLRILHLYNDILKKRMKMKKTMQKKAIQSIREHYLSSNTLLSLRMRFPRALGWLRALPAARARCLVCGEAEPTRDDVCGGKWRRCAGCDCPFVYCGECWRELGRCLHCRPSSRASVLSDPSRD